MLECVLNTLKNWRGRVISFFTLFLNLFFSCRISWIDLAIFHFACHVKLKQITRLEFVAGIKDLYQNAGFKMTFKNREERCRFKNKSYILAGQNWLLSNGTKEKCGISCDVFRASTYPPHTLEYLFITHIYHPGLKKTKLVNFLANFELYHISNTRTVKVSFQGEKDYKISTFYCRYTCLPPLSIPADAWLFGCIFLIIIKIVFS